MRRLIVVLPCAPDERDSHDAVIAAAGALQASVDVLQLVPEAGAATPRGSDAVRWWEIVHPRADADAAPQLVAALVTQALRDPRFGELAAALIVLPAGPQSEATAAGLAASLDGATLGRCSRLARDGESVTGVRAAFGGRLQAHLRSAARVCCAAWRPDTPAAPLAAVPASRVQSIAVDYQAPPPWPAETIPSTDRQARLEGARLVVSGGRGVAGADGFGLLARVANALGGAVAGSLPAVDAGWVPVARQVGVSGKFVAPRLYVAVGISGTPQHLAGIAAGTRIVAVNSDADAPIFGVADVGVVADWRELLPALLARLEGQA